MLAAQCDGLGNCPEAVEMTCSPFACGETACLDSCVSDEDCAANARCDLASGTCKTGATCDGDHTATDLTGQPVDCSPFRCTPNGSCKTECASVLDCMAGLICDGHGQCVVPARSDGETQSGCSLASGARPPRGATWAMLWVATAVAARGRGRRGGGMSRSGGRPLVAGRRHCLRDGYS